MHSRWVATYSGTLTVADNFFRARMPNLPRFSSCQSQRSLRWVCISSCTSTNGRCVLGPCGHMALSESRIRSLDGSRWSLVRLRFADTVAMAPLGSVSHIISWCVSHDMIPLHRKGIEWRRKGHTYVFPSIFFVLGRTSRAAALSHMVSF